MFRATFVSLVATALATVLAFQVPFNITSVQHGQEDLGGKDLTGWNLDRLPNPNATDHLVFETVHSLFQRWPNTRMRNGHTVVPGIIPKGTLLYHGGTSNELPSGPEWVATDPEHSFLFCRDVLTHTEMEGWHLTLMASRPLKVVYFDGSSAAKLPYGSMDTQDLIAWGKMGDLFEDEMKRAKDLCKWGRDLGVDGIVRMQMDFEIMLCDFTSGVSTVSFVRLVNGWTNQSFIQDYNSFAVLTSGSWHNHFPGEARIQLDLPGLVSFYDTELVPSLVPIRAGKERWDHRAANISSEDLVAIKSRLEANLIIPDGVSSGIDWKTLIQVIVDRFAERFELMRYLLNSSVTNPDDILGFSKKVQTQLRIMLTPYLLFSATPSVSSDDLDWANPIYRLCATTHTYSMELLSGSLTDSEKLLLRAARGTSREICRTVTKMWVAGVYAGIDPLLHTMEFPDITAVTRLRQGWAEELDRLMGWLDWHVWVKCKSDCSPEEMCYLPTWPIGFPWLAKFPIPSPHPLPDDDELMGKLTSFELRNMIMKSVAHEISNAIKPEQNEWIRPQPKCIRRIKPYLY